MRIRVLRVRNFRGIKALDWQPESGFTCLIGPGDSTKSTIIDAVELALSPRWNVSFDDNDFYNGDSSALIEIELTVADIPAKWKAEEKFGLCLRGWKAGGGFTELPEDGEEAVVTIRLRVDATLEPTWAVVTDKTQDGRHIGAKDREQAGCTRLGASPDRHLSWGRGSALSRITGDVDGLGHLLADAARAARTALTPDKVPDLRNAAARVQEIGREHGVSPMTEYKPSLDVQAVTVGAAGLALHDGAVPLRMAGLGTRRLLAVGMQRDVAKAGGVVLVDEVEHGLEPHRLRHLLRVLRSGVALGAGTGNRVLVTTHSSVVVSELDAADLGVVRCTAGTTTVSTVPDVLQPVVKCAGEALLARKILVCEGDTELGFCRGLDWWWTGTTGDSFGYLGLGLVDGQGSKATKTAAGLLDLGYRVAFLGDSDVPTSPTCEEIARKGASVFVWDGTMALEQRLASDLPWEGILDLVAIRREEKGDQSVRAQVASQLGVGVSDLPLDPTQWTVLGEDKVRAAIASAAKGSKKNKDGKKDGGWFKRVDLGIRLAEVVIKHLAAVEARELGLKIVALRNWMTANG